jgi:hypothetical protein
MIMKNSKIIFLRQYKQGIVPWLSLVDRMGCHGCGEEFEITTFPS